MSLTLMVFFSAGISVLAETIEQKDVDVTAQYIQTAEGFNQAPVKNGEGSLTTEEGVKVSVSGAPGKCQISGYMPYSEKYRWRQMADQMFKW